MRPKQHATTGSGDLFRVKFEQIINMKHELVQLASKIDWMWIDGEIAPVCIENLNAQVPGRLGLAIQVEDPA